MSSSMLIPGLVAFHNTELGACMDGKGLTCDLLREAQHGSRGASKCAPRPVPGSTTGPQYGERKPT